MDNEEYIRRCILLKNQSFPYESYADDIKHVITDVDHFPYTRFYRGEYNNSQPIIWEREAGYRPLQNYNYIKHNLYNVKPHHSPMQLPCNTILPKKFDEKDNLSMTWGCVNRSP